EPTIKALALLGLITVPVLPFVYRVWVIDYKAGLYSTYRSFVGFRTQATDTQFLAGKSPVIEFCQDNNPPEPTGSFTVILKDGKGDIELFDVEHISTVNKIKQSLADYNVTFLVTT
ncbi:MAG TPA: hypothetical protein VK174_01655, partial [Chitinophagales bacterium]|nr:hypothetical protein [Chitinophagales bacterium]